MNRVTNVTKENGLLIHEVTSITEDDKSYTSVTALGVCVRVLDTFNRSPSCLL